MVKTENFTIGEAHIHTSKGVITKSDQIDEITKNNQLSKIPDSFFGDNFIKINTPFYDINISAIDSCKYLKYSELKTKHFTKNETVNNFSQIPFFFVNDIKVSNSKTWSQLKILHGNELIKEQFLDQDWTYLNHYRGLIDISEKVTVKNETKNIEIPKNRLTQENKILFYSDLFLYEDDLGDFGYSCLRSRMRVQNDSAFILLRSYIRIDGNRIRSIDNRIFIDFEDYSIIREISFFDSTYQEIIEAGFMFEPGFNTDMEQTDKVNRFLKLVFKKCDKFTFSKE